MRLLDTVNRSAREVDAKSSTESYFGERARILASKGTTLYALCEVQNFSIELYESRIVSMQRFVAMTVMFHEMGRRVQRFFHRLSFGYLGYRMDRTHSNIRIASTASPVSGSDVRAIFGYYQDQEYSSKGGQYHFVGLVHVSSEESSASAAAWHLYWDNRYVEEWKVIRRRDRIHLDGCKQVQIHVK